MSSALCLFKNLTTRNLRCWFIENYDNSPLLPLFIFYRKSFYEYNVYTKNMLVKDKTDSTPLHFAVRTNQLSFVKHLLGADANPNVQDENGITPLHSAVRTKKLAIVSALLDAKANPNMTDEYGNTPLHTAVRANSAPIVSALLRAGARTNIKNASHSTPLDEAIRRGYPKIVKMLLHNGANPAQKTIADAQNIKKKATREIIINYLQKEDVFRKTRNLYSKTNTSASGTLPAEMAEQVIRYRHLGSV
jgi:ankyrin repeat protein